MALSHEDLKQSDYPLGLGYYDRARGEARKGWEQAQTDAIAGSSTREPLGALSVAEMAFVDDAYKPTQLDRNLTLQLDNSWNGHSL